MRDYVRTQLSLLRGSRRPAESIENSLIWIAASGIIPWNFELRAFGRKTSVL